MRIFHIVDPLVWEQACAAGEYRPSSLGTEGFVHCSFAEQVESVASNLYADAGDLVAVELESGDIPAEVRVEDSYGAGESFPHVYGPIPPAAQTGCRRLRKTPGGDWVWAQDDGAPPGPESQRVDSSDRLASTDVNPDALDVSRGGAAAPASPDR